MMLTGGALLSSLLRREGKASEVGHSLCRHFCSTLRKKGIKDDDVVILGGARTPIGRFLGALAPLKGPQLGSVAIRGALEKTGVAPEQVEEVYLGNVVGAGAGQAPARQAALGAGLPTTVPCTTVNKVCASGLKSVSLAAQAIKCRDRDLVIAGGFESMSNIPHYLPNLRSGQKMGAGTLIDGAIHDGLWDVYNDQHMGMCGEICAEKFGFSREAQDAYALESYARARRARDAGLLDGEIVPVEVPVRAGLMVVDRDEEDLAPDPQRLRALRPAFKKDGTVTAANASSLNDGAAALIVASGAKARALGLTPIAKILSYADAARDPVEFTVAPADAVRQACARAGGLEPRSLRRHEINEAFAVVPLANARLLGIDDLGIVNPWGGAVAIGHPIGMSGARIALSLARGLHQQGGRAVGCASICNGGGGASALILASIDF